MFYAEDFLIIVIGIVRTGIRLFVFKFDGFRDEIISFDTDRSIEIVVEDGTVSERVHGIDAWVFVLLNDDVEPPVDVDWRCKFDVVAPIDERRFVDIGGLVRTFVVGGGRRMGTKRWVRDWVLVIVADFDKGAVSGRTFDALTFPFTTGCLLWEEVLRGTVLMIGV